MAMTFVDPGPAHYAVKDGAAQAVPYPLWLGEPEGRLWGVATAPNGLMGSNDGGTPGAVLAAAQYSVKLGDAGENLEIYNCFEGGEGDSGSFASLVVRLFADPVYLIESQNIVLRLRAQTTYRSNAPFNPFEGGEVSAMEHTLDLAVPAAMLAHVEAAIAGDPDTQELLANATKDTLLTWLLDNASADAAAFGGLRYTRRSDGIYLGLGDINQMVFAAEDFAAFAPLAESLGLWGGSGYTASFGDSPPVELYIGHYELGDAPPAEKFWTGYVLTFER